MAKKEKVASTRIVKAKKKGKAKKRPNKRETTKAYRGQGK